MSAEHRKNVRRRVSQRAVMAEADGKIMGACVISNISESGAKLVLPGTSVLPAEFILLLSPNGGVSRHCRLVWRSEREAGVSFVSRNEVA